MQQSLRGLRSRTVSEEKPISSARAESRKIHPKVPRIEDGNYLLEKIHNSNSRDYHTNLIIVGSLM